MIFFKKLFNLHFLQLFALGLTLYLFPLGQLGRIRFFQSEAFFYLYEIPLAFLLLFSVSNLLKRKVFSSTLARSGLVFIFAIFISLFISLFYNSLNSSIIAFLYFFRLATYIILISFADNIWERFKKYQTIKLLIFSGFAFFILSSIIQLFYIPKIDVLSYLGWDPHMYRVVGVFYDPPIAISFFVIFLIVLFFLRNIPMKITILGIIVCLMLAIFTFSRGGIIALFFTFFIYFFKTKYLKLLLTFFILSALILGTLSNYKIESVNIWRTTSITTRVNDNLSGIKIWLRSPIFGIGYNQLRTEKVKLSEKVLTKNDISHGLSAFHSSFTTILVTSGVVGLGFFIYLLYNLFKLSKIHQYVMIFLGMISLFDNVLLHPMILFLIFILSFFIDKKT